MRISICHCFACQRRTGAPFGAQARFPKDAVKTSGNATTWVRTADSGNTIHQHFCPTCGSTVYLELDAVPGFVTVALGAFADPAFPAPTVAVFEARAHSWARMGELELERLL